ncbi:MAG: methyl-accepting chemotaxis protein [Roseburia sp.]|nr:methyl-accepting chemotaxis protein [Roseburia sp.]
MKKQEKNRFASIKTKLLGTIIPVVVLLIVVLLLVAYNVSAGIIEEYSRNLLESSVSNQTSRIEAWLNENLSAFQIVKETIEKVQPKEADLQKMLDSYYGYNANYPEGLYVADSTGKLLKAAESTKQEADVLNSTWYREGITRINMAYGSAYQNAEGVNVISASGILNDGTDNIKVIAADMTLDRITIIVNSFIEMDEAEAFLVDTNDGTILAHRDSAMISRKLGEEGQSAFYGAVAEKMAAADFNFCTLEGNMTVFKEITGTNWLLVSYIPTDIVLADLAKLRSIMLIISIIAILVLCVIVERVTHMVIRPVKKLTETITAMTSGDFTVSVHTKGNDEIAVMSRSVEKFIDSMRAMISSMGDISGRLKGQAISCDDVSNNMNDAANIQAQSMGELNITVDQLSVSVNEIAENATMLAGYAADTKADSDAVEHKMRETVEVSEKGRKDMERVGEALESIRLSVQNLETAVNKVGTASGEIVQIVQFIGNIADETNMLSLNASIEAARAGEAGKGFAVVATEIGKLAQNSTESVENITRLIQQINVLVEDAVRQAADSAGEIGNSAELIHTAVDTFDVIFQNVQDTSRLIEGVVDKINQVDQVATNVAAISEEQAASSDEILATSESMLQQAKGITENSEQVAKEAKNLAVSSENLAGQVQQFQI